MLIASLVLSLITLLLIGVAAAQRNCAAACGIAVGAFILNLNGLLMLYCFFFQALFLLILTWVWARLQFSQLRFIAFACAGTVAIYLVAGLLVLQDNERLRTQFAFTSMEERLPRRSLTPASNSPDEQALQSDVETSITTRAWWPEYRTRRLETLHVETVQAFIESPGFGVGRHNHHLSMSDNLFETAMRSEKPAPQPGERSYVPLSSADFESPKFSTPSDALTKLHVNAYVDFAFVDGFGYFKDRQRVAGFLPHGMSRAPEATGGSALRTVDLVSLLIHQPYAVYISRELPRMDRLKDIPTRPLDLFEEASLQAIQQGKPLVVWEKDEHVRMLGAIRAVQQCVRCHDCQVGDLLGAFSYTFTR